MSASQSASTEARELVPIERPSLTAIVTPLVDAATARVAIQQYEELKSAIVRETDKQIFYRKVRKGDKWLSEPQVFLKKSFWRRLATYFGLSLELVREEKIVDAQTAVIGYRVMYRAVAPNGRSMESDGMCVADEKSGELKTEHTTRATAHTRAKNRAISDLVGGGEVSAEELEGSASRQIVAPSNAAKTTWGSLRKRALAVNITTQGEWEDTVCQVTGKNDATAMTTRDLAKVEAYVANRERQKTAPQIVDGSLAADRTDDSETDENEYDLEQLDVPEVTP